MCLDNIIEVIKEELKIDLLKENNRKQEVVDARRIYSDIARQLNIFSFSEIGKKIKKNHATIIYFCKTSEDFKITDQFYNDKYNRVFDKTIKIHSKKSILINYNYYKKKHHKYRDLLSKLKKESLNLNKIT